MPKLSLLRNRVSLKSIMEENTIPNNLKLRVDDDSACLQLVYDKQVKIRPKHSIKPVLVKPSRHKPSLNDQNKFTNSASSSNWNQFSQYANKEFNNSNKQLNKTCRTQSFRNQYFSTIKTIEKSKIQSTSSFLSPKIKGFLSPCNSRPDMKSNQSQAQKSGPVQNVFLLQSQYRVQQQKRQQQSELIAQKIKSFCFQFYTKKQTQIIQFKKNAQANVQAINLKQLAKEQIANICMKKKMKQMRQSKQSIKGSKNSIQFQENQESKQPSQQNYSDQRIISINRRAELKKFLKTISEKFEDSVERLNQSPDKQIVYNQDCVSQSNQYFKHHIYDDPLSQTNASSASGVFQDFFLFKGEKKITQSNRLSYDLNELK